MTEQEAKTKWCPFARVDADGAAGANRYPEVEADGSTIPEDQRVTPLTNTCVGSACMAFRVETDAYGPTGKVYCGLAGKP